MSMTAQAAVERGVNQEIVAAVRRFVAAEVTPFATQYERDGVHPWTLRGTLAEMGLFAAGIDEEFGGIALNEATRERIVEELSYGWSSLAVTVTQQWVAAGLINTFGTPAQKARWLPGLATADVVAAISLSEPGGGSDNKAMTCRATLDGDTWLINGEKTWVTNGSRADVVVLAAKTDGDSISAFVLDMTELPADCPTLTISKPFDKLGHRMSDTVQMSYADHRVPADSLLGGHEMLGRGLHAFLHKLDLGRIHIGAVALGIARAALDSALDYAAVRQTFGKPIDQHQAIQFKLADMATKVRTAQLLIDDAARKWDDGEEAGLECSMAKLQCSEVALEVTEQALRIHAGIGYVSELPIERYYRDAPLLAIGEGTNEIQHILIARGLKRRGGLGR